MIVFEKFFLMIKIKRRFAMKKLALVFLIIIAFLITPITTMANDCGICGNESCCVSGEVIIKVVALSNSDDANMYYDYYKSYTFNFHCSFPAGFPTIINGCLVIIPKTKLKSIYMIREGVQGFQKNPITLHVKNSCLVFEKTTTVMSQDTIRIFATDCDGVEYNIAIDDQINEVYCLQGVKFASEGDGFIVK
jgi:hypothetical protein